MAQKRLGMDDVATYSSAGSGTVGGPGAAFGAVGAAVGSAADAVKDAVKDVATAAAGVVTDPMEALGDAVRIATTTLNPFYWANKAVIAGVDAVSGEGTKLDDAAEWADDAADKAGDWIEDHPLETIAIVGTGAAGGALLGGSTGLLAPVAEFGAGLGGAAGIANGLGTAAELAGAGLGAAGAVATTVAQLNPPPTTTPTTAATDAAGPSADLSFWEWLGQLVDELGAALFG